MHRGGCISEKKIADGTRPRPFALVTAKSGESGTGGDIWKKTDARTETARQPTQRV
jgi:hypothetical protein